MEPRPSNSLPHPCEPPGPNKPLKCYDAAMSTTGPQPFSFRSRRFLLFLLAIFGFRFLFGLYCPPIIIGDDDIQTYVIGLKCHTTHTWPYFGPDVQGLDTPFKTQIPGALEGLLIALPLEVLPIPESPYLFLNLLSLLAFGFMAWYCCKKLPNLSPWFVFTGVYLAPWSLHYSTMIINPSYAILGSILFFVGFFETLPAFNPKVLPPVLSNAMMGFGFLWVYQLHMSWVLLGPFLALSISLQWRQTPKATPLLSMGLGALPMLALLVPTYLRYGFTSGHDIQGVLSGVNWKHVMGLLDITGKFLSFSSFEMPRFIGLSIGARVDYLVRHWVLLVPGVFLWFVGIAQPLAMVWFGVMKRKERRRDWKAVTWVALGTALLIWASFWFTVKDCRSHTFYITLPVAFVFSFYCWDFLATSPFWRGFAKVFLAMVVLFQVGYTYVAYKDDASVYQLTRRKIEQALQQNDYRFLAERRLNTPY